MDPAGLDCILPELLFYLCLFLSEADIISLSHTCTRLRDVLNVDEVWKRFVTEEIRSLKTLKPLLDPAFHPDLNLCENRQHLQRRDHLISNWRNGKGVTKSTKIEKRFRRERFYLFQTQYYKENYLLVKFDQDFSNNHHVFYNLDWAPEVHAHKNFRDFFYIFGDRFVSRICCGVEVYQINIKDNVFPLLYNFLITGEDLNNFDYDKNNCNPNDRCPQWEESSGGNYLVINKASPEPAHPFLHIWDIVNAKKVGVFVAPVICNFVKVFAALNDTLILSTQHDYEETIHFKFDVSTKRFSNAVFKTSVAPLSVLFYKDFCTTMEDSRSGSEKSVVCKTFEFNTSRKIVERRFLDADYEYQQKCHPHSWGGRDNTFLAVDGKIVIMSSNSFHVVDILSLETLTVIPNELNLIRVIGNFSVFGTVFLTTVGRNGSVQMWDVEKKQVISNLSCETLNETSLWRVRQFQRDFCHVPGNGPETKFVITDEERITVTHFW